MVNLVGSFIQFAPFLPLPQPLLPPSLGTIPPDLLSLPEQGLMPTLARLYSVRWPSSSHWLCSQRRLSLVETLRSQEEVAIVSSAGVLDSSRHPHASAIPLLICLVHPVAPISDLSYNSIGPGDGEGGGRSMKTKQAHNAEMPPDMCACVFCSSPGTYQLGSKRRERGSNRRLQGRPQLSDQNRCSGNAEYWFLALVAQAALPPPLSCLKKRPRLTLPNGKHGTLCRQLLDYSSRAFCNRRTYNTVFSIWT